MTKPVSPKYDAPRAVRLSDANTASLSCITGPIGTGDVCTSGTLATGHNVCGTGSSVQNTW